MSDFDVRDAARLLISGGTALALSEVVDPYLNEILDPINKWWVYFIARAAVLGIGQFIGEVIARAVVDALLGRR